MKHSWIVTAVSMLGLGLAAAMPQASPNSEKNSNAPMYTQDGKLKFPANYREWVYLSTGFDMSYRPTMQMGHHMFDNVFVDPQSYRAFLKTATWPDKTMFVLEERGARDHGSINRTGNYQDVEIMGLAVHLKDERRFPDKWAFFEFDGKAAGRLVPRTADCYSCHAAHAAVDTTFVQFYPTLLPLATSKGTLARSYLAEEAVANPATSPHEAQH